MTNINCKSCGCPNEVKEGQTTIICEACGTEQTIPNLNSEKKMNLFNRANAARLKYDFEKALQNYEQIIIDYPNDAEAHWGICLCRYGIEYVYDPKTKKKIPTCHRTIYQSIFDDVDYKETINNADVIAKKIYQSEAEAIDRIQKSIIAISQKEDPYDVFICYKETDENNNRTRDSFVAEDIYNELTSKGYKVFFSRITLESKLGQQYEPIIFAALQSARVMLVIGSKKEYFEAVWVKNEWTRYLSFMQDNKASKYMIPCYRDMEAYDMPDEFLFLQSQNLDRLGAKQDLIRAIDKVFGKDKTIVKEIKNNIEYSNKNYNLIKRAAILIEDEEYTKADSLLEETLNNDPECAEAYAYKILISKKLHFLDDLGKLNEPLDDDKNYQKVVRFADSEFKTIIEGYNNKILSNLDEKNKKSIYNSAISAKNKGNFEEAITLFNKILNYNDSSSQLSICETSIKDGIYNRALNYKNQKSYDFAITLFNKVIYYKDAQAEIEDCKNLKVLEEKENIYSKYTKIAVTASSHDKFNEQEFKQAIYQLKTIIDYKYVEEFINKYETLFANMKNQLAEEEEQKRLEQERLAEERRLEAIRIREEKEKRAKIRKDKRIRFLKIFTPIALVIIALIILTFTLFIPMGKYNKAMDLIEQGKYSEAAEILNETSFSDSEQQIKLISAESSLSHGDYETAIDIIYNLGGTVDIKYYGNGGTPTKSDETIKRSYVQNEANKDGYTFYGWVLSEYNIDFKNHNASITLKASYTPIEYSINYNLNGGIFLDSYPKRYIRTDEVTIPNPEKEGYTFVGWTGTNLDTPTKDFSFKDEFGNKKFTANWVANTYTITYDVNGGNELLNDTQQVTYGQTYELITPTRDRYEFVGWYTVTHELYKNGIWLNESNVTLMAKWEIITYSISYELDGGTNSALNPSTYTYETETITLSDPTKTGYTFLGWTNSSITTPIKNLTIEKNSTGEKTFITNWEANTYTITYDVNGGNELLSNVQDVTYDMKYELVVPTRDGYGFLGWYTASNELYDNGIWITASNVTLIAKWGKKYTVTMEPLESEYIGESTYEVTYGKSFVFPTARIINKHYIRNSFKGWKYNGTLITDSNGKLLENWNIESNVTLVPEFGEKEDGVIYFGSYPQSEVKASEENGLNQIIFNSSTWNDYGYYISGAVSSYMYYIDIDIDSNGTYDYRGVYFTQYRPYYTTMSSSIANSHQDDNSYYRNTIYWFKYEPIKWNVLKEENGKALIIADLILDSQDYNYTCSLRSGATDYQGNSTSSTVYGNDYMYSHIRSWLNTTFYDTAFNDLEKAIIETTLVDNSASSTNDSYVCSNTNDKIFLLSYEEVTTYYTEEVTTYYTIASRQAQGTDYAKCQGLSAGSSYSDWWGRSPNYFNDYDAFLVYDNGYIRCCSVPYILGVRAACWINL